MKIKFSIAIAIFFFAGLFSCNEDYLVKYPLDKPSDETFFSTQSELTLAVNAIYKNLYFMPGNKIPLQIHLDCASDIAWDRDAGSSIQLLGKGLITQNHSLINDTWFSFYSAISKCNMLLANMNKAKENTLPTIFSRIEGEARFFRAYYYHLLTTYYGDVPFITEPIGYEDAQIPSTDKDEIDKFIISELEAASTLLPKSYTGSDKGRVTQATALAIKARAALFNEKWDVAADACKRIIDMGIYELYPDYGKLFTYAAENNNKEEIFTVQFARGYSIQEIPQTLFSRMAGGWSNKIPTQTMVDSYYCIDGLPINESPLYDAKKPFVNRDPRLQASIVVPGSIFVGFQFETHPDSTKCWDYNTTPPSRKTNQDVTNPYATFSGYCWRKYTDEVREYKNASELNIMLVRYAEILLMYAEAKIELNQIDETVYSAINKVRKRVNMPDVSSGKTQAQLRYLLRQERKVELAYEGLRYFDIRRWKISHEVIPGPLYGRPKRDYLSSYIPTFDKNGLAHYDGYADKLRVFDNRSFNSQRDYLWPIPQKELDINKNLSQNTGY